MVKLVILTLIVYSQKGGITVLKSDLPDGLSTLSFPVLFHGGSQENLALCS